MAYERNIVFRRYSASVSVDGTVPILVKRVCTGVRKKVVVRKFDDEQKCILVEN